VKVIIALALPERAGYESPAIEKAIGATTKNVRSAAKNPTNAVAAVLIVVANRIPQAVINPALIKSDLRPRSPTAAGGSISQPLKAINCAIKSTTTLLAMLFKRVPSFSMPAPHNGAEFTAYLAQADPIKIFMKGLLDFLRTLEFSPRLSNVRIAKQAF
jgi:hypothetical protein